MNDAVTVYVPSLKPEILNDPSWLDEAPVSVPSTATLAPARALPSAPLTVPVMFWANSVATEKSKAIIYWKLLILIFIIYTSFFIYYQLVFSVS